MKWILIISIIMLVPSLTMGALIYPYYYYSPLPRSPDVWETVALYTNRISTLLFMATITTATLSTTGFGKKDLLCRISNYLFISSMALLFITVIKILFTFQPIG